MTVTTEDENQPLIRKSNSTFFCRRKAARSNVLLTGRLSSLVTSITSSLLVLFMNNIIGNCKTEQRENVNSSFDIETCAYGNPKVDLLFFLGVSFAMTSILTNVVFTSIYGNHKTTKPDLLAYGLLAMILLLLGIPAAVLYSRAENTSDGNLTITNSISDPVNSIVTEASDEKIWELLVDFTVISIETLSFVLAVFCLWRDRRYLPDFPIPPSTTNTMTH